MENLENIILIEKHKIPLYIRIAQVIGIMSSKKFDNDISDDIIKKDLWNNKESKYHILTDDIIRHFKEDLGEIITKKDICEVLSKGSFSGYQIDGEAIYVYSNVYLVRSAQKQILHVNLLQNKSEHNHQ